MPAKLKLALIGCGAISGWHRLNINKVPEIEITAAIDVDRVRAEAAAEESRAAVFTSVADALAKGDFDAVDIMLPHHLHEEVALQCFAARKHVLLEKPMAPTLAACDRLLTAARAASVVFTVGENAQYWPEIVIARDAIRGGAIGDLVTAHVHFFFPPMPAFYGGDQPWRMSRALAGGGICIDTGSHYIRPLRMWLGEIAAVIAAMERPFEQMEGESLVRALFRFRSGRVASFDVLMTAAPIARQDVFRITGSQGEILIGHDTQSAGKMQVVLYDAEHPGGVRIGDEIPRGYLLSYEGEFRDFADAVLRGGAIAANAEYSLGELRTALAMERSAQTRCWETVWT